PWLVSATAMVNHFYFYAVDEDFGPFFIKFGTYFPYTAKVCLNGHHWAQCQATKAGIGHEGLDNAFGGPRRPTAHLRAPLAGQDRAVLPQVAGPPASSRR
ncbi:MAG TPA: hypothetical protein VK988_05675, partial [Acidimicrobiales bacterium]|nr:hypothetical protein [Acidimicrobiales bacterium]